MAEADNWFPRNTSTKLETGSGHENNMLGSDQAKGFEMLGLAWANGFEKIGLACANGINSQRIMREMMGKKGLRPAFSPKKEAFKQKEIGVRSSPFSTKYNVHCALMEINNGELTKED